MATGATHKKQDDPTDDHKLLTDDEFAAAASREFAQAQQGQAQSSADAARSENIWRNIEQRLSAADRGIGAMSTGKKALIAGLVMAASAAFAGIFISGSLQTAEETTAIKGWDSARRVIAVALTSAEVATPNIVVTSPSAGWLTVFIRNGDSYTPWIKEAKLESGDTPFHAIDHPLPVGLKWPAPSDDHIRYNVCAVAITHRSALAMMEGNIAKLWSSFTSTNCLY